MGNWESATKHWLVDLTISALPGCPSPRLDDRDYTVNSTGQIMASLDGCLMLC